MTACVIQFETRVHDPYGAGLANRIWSEQWWPGSAHRTEPLLRELVGWLVHSRADRMPKLTLRMEARL
jgi:hypothetical protein